MFAPSPASHRWWLEETAAAQTQPPDKQSAETVETARRRERMMRDTVLHLFHRYQGQCAYQRWCDEVDSRPEPPPSPQPPPPLDPSHFHCHPTSPPFIASSSSPYLVWLQDKTAQYLSSQRRHRLHEQRRQAEEASAKAEAARVAEHKFAQWTAVKQRQQRALQAVVSRRSAQQLLADQQRRDERSVLFRQHFRRWRTVKAAEAERQQRREQRAQQRQQLRRQQRKTEFDAQFPTLVATYVHTLEQWRRDEAQARLRQAQTHKRPHGAQAPKSRPSTQSTEAVRPASRKGGMGLELSMASTVESMASTASTARSDLSAKGSIEAAQRTGRRRRPAWNADTSVS